jgi:hypothetical protein
MKKSPFCLLLAFLAFSASGQPYNSTYNSIPAIAVGNLFYLSDIYKQYLKEIIPECDSPDVGFENLLLRAKAQGYTYAVAGVPVKEVGYCHAWINGKDSLIYGSFFYPHLLDRNTQQPVRYFREAFKKADSLGMILIPLIFVACQLDGIWSNLHPRLDSTDSAANIVLNS